MDGRAAPGSRATSRGLRLLPHDAAGLCGAALLWLMGLTPSLLPRPAVVAAGLAGLLAALGYGIGCAVGWLVRWVVGTESRVSPRWTYGLSAALWAVAFVMTVVSTGWQRQQLADLGMDATPPPWWTVLVGGLLIAWLLVGLARGLRAVARTTAHRLGQHTQRWLAAVVGVLAAGALAGAVIGLGYAATWFAFDRIDRAGSSQSAPVSAARSGGPGSLVPFASLGAEGQSFVVGGPSVADIAEYAGVPAREPIRVYVGLASAPDARARAGLAVQELQRTGAFERRMLVVATSTGNGFLDPDLVAAPEFLEGGDIATVSLQYSVLPSWLSFLVDGNTAQESATALLAAVQSAIASLPVGERPLLAVSGESLGALGSQAPFAGMSPTQVADQVDAAVWVGTPAASSLWSSWRDDRTAGPVWEPIIGDSTVARNPATAGSPVWSQPDWGSHRIVLTQHANDPVSWWSPALLWSRPDWVNEPRGPGVDPRLTWLPLILFAQTGLDLAAAGAVPPGVGHDYGDVTGQAWAYALDVPGEDGGPWLASDTARLTAALHS